jgi:beta-lactamase regulating signal transducer with metallopeptidase domain
VEERSVEPHLTWPVGSLVTAILLGAWGIGSLVWWGLNARLVARFGRQLRVVGLRDRQLERRAGELAARLGLVRVPQIHIIDMGVAPMLWGCAKWTKIVLPARLLERLDDESRDALLLHELAHFRRGDQWVRVLELIATGLYWWHPVVWWAKRQIAVHEEECCDALAVSHSPTPRRYADVLLETLDFIADYRPGLVPVSSAISDVPVIERRLHMIMTGGIPWSLSNWGRCGLICLLAVLPYQPLLMAAVPVAAPNEVQRSANVLVPSAVRSIADPGGLVDQTYASPPIAQSPAGFVGSIREIRLPPTTEHPLLETGPSQDVWSAAASMNGRYQLRALSGGRVHLSDGSSGRTTDLTREGITAAVFLNREHLLAGTKAGDVRIYDAASGAAVSFLGQHREEVTSVALMSNSRRAVTASRDGGIFVWDLETNGAILYQGNIQRPISMLRPSPDGRVLAVACGDWLSKAGTAVLLDFASGELREFQAGAPIGALAFQANGDLLLTADWEGRVTFWDVATGDQLGHGRVAKDAVSAAGFSPDMDALSKLVMTDTVGTGAADMAPPASLPQR